MSSHSAEPLQIYIHFDLWVLFRCQEKNASQMQYFLKMLFQIYRLPDCAWLVGILKELTNVNPINDPALLICWWSHGGRSGISTVASGCSSIGSTGILTVVSGCGDSNTFHCVLWKYTALTIVVLLLFPEFSAIQGLNPQRQFTFQSSATRLLDIASDNYSVACNSLPPLTMLTSYEEVLWSQHGTVCNTPLGICWC